MALLARIEEQSAEERGSERFRLRLDSPGQAQTSGASGVTVHELSASGFLIETDAPLALDSPITFELPVAGVVAGEIVWGSGNYFGGQFRTPLSRDALGAALAASRVVWPNFAPTSAVRRTPAALLDQASAQEEVLPLSTRIQIIVGSSLLLWSVIGAAVWFVSQAVR